MHNTPCTPGMSTNLWILENKIFSVSNKYWYLNYYIIDIEIYSYICQNIFANIFFLFHSISPQNVSFQVPIFHVFHIGPRIYLNICSKLCLKYIWIFVLEVFNLSNMFAYLFEEVLVFWIHSNILSSPFSNIRSSLLYTSHCTLQRVPSLPMTWPLTCCLEILCWGNFLTESPLNLIKTL